MFIYKTREIPIDGKFLVQRPLEYVRTSEPPAATVFLDCLRRVLRSCIQTNNTEPTGLSSIALEWGFGSTLLCMYTQWCHSAWSNKKNHEQIGEIFLVKHNLPTSLIPLIESNIFELSASKSTTIFIKLICEWEGGCYHSPFGQLQQIWMRCSLRMHISSHWSACIDLLP